MSYRRKDKPKKSIRQTNKPFKGISLEKKKDEIKKNQPEENKIQDDAWLKVKKRLKYIRKRFLKN